MCTVTQKRTRVTTGIFRKRAKFVHGDEYDYSKSVYITSNVKLEIICRKHGSFWQTLGNHIGRRSICPTCSRERNGTKEEKTLKYICRFRIVHGDKYDYSLFQFVNHRKKSKIICHEHGVFLQRVDMHLSGKGCTHCGQARRVIKLTKKTEQWLKQAVDVHGDLFDYSQVEYVNTRTNLKIICKIHGMFEQLPKCHLTSTTGCKDCIRINASLTNEQFKEKANKIQNNKYDYSKSNYLGCRHKVEIICPFHGSFWQEAGDHYIKGSGCPTCAETGLERIARTTLESLGLSYLIEHRFKSLAIYRFDFYVPNHAILIEMDGEQHFRPNDFYGGQEGFEATQRRDKVKNQFAKDNGYTLIRIPYNAEPSPEVMLRSELAKLNLHEHQKEYSELASPLPQVAMYQPSLF